MVRPAQILYSKLITKSQKNGPYPAVLPVDIVHYGHGPAIKSSKATIKVFPE